MWAKTIIVLVGVQPLLTQMPPICSRSISAVVRPDWARVRASRVPACPAPTTTASFYFGIAIVGSST
jgi:hypothetical protein